MTIIPEKLDILTAVCNCLGFELKYVLLKETFAHVGEGNNISLSGASRDRAKNEKRGKHRCIERIDFPQQSTKSDTPK